MVCGNPTHRGRQGQQGTVACAAGASRRAGRRGGRLCGHVECAARLCCGVVRNIALDDGNHDVHRRSYCCYSCGWRLTDGLSEGGGGAGSLISASMLGAMAHARIARMGLGSHAWPCCPAGRARVWCEGADTRPHRARLATGTSGSLHPPLPLPLPPWLSHGLCPTSRSGTDSVPIPPSLAVGNPCNRHMYPVLPVVVAGMNAFSHVCHKDMGVHQPPDAPAGTARRPTRRPRSCQ